MWLLQEFPAKTFGEPFDVMQGRISGGTFVWISKGILKEFLEGLQNESLKIVLKKIRENPQRSTWGNFRKKSWILKEIYKTQDGSPVETVAGIFGGYPERNYRGFFKEFSNKLLRKFLEEFWNDATEELLKKIVEEFMKEFSIAFL